jgi:hypothetical protein
MPSQKAPAVEGPRTIERIAEMAREHGWSPKDVNNLVDYMKMSAASATPEEAAAEYQDDYGPHRFSAQARRISEIIEKADANGKTPRAKPQQPKGDQRSRLEAQIEQADSEPAPRGNHR